MFFKFSFKGNKVGVVIFFNGSDANWKNHLNELNDLAGDFFEEASLIGVDARFFKQIIEKFPGSGEGSAAVFQKEEFDKCTIVKNDTASIRATVKERLKK